MDMTKAPELNGQEAKEDPTKSNGNNHEHFRTDREVLMFKNNNDNRHPTLTNWPPLTRPRSFKFNHP
jgi:hypothetical protein